MLNRLTEINLTASDPDDWASDYVRVQFNDGALRGHFFYIKGHPAQLVLESVARICLEGWMQANDSKVMNSGFEALDRQREAKCRAEKSAHNEAA
jgi:hypothetical protein